ncbi:MAG: hypothetical protein AB1555_13680 [Nitrospirota bacterium]
MEGLGDSLLLLGIAGFLLALLIHAIRTLMGMREKLLYPLLRVKAPDGGLSPMMRVKPDRRGAMHTHLACAV